MKQNKGIASLSLIVLIVLGVAVVGGGAYFLGKSDSKKEIVDSQNLLQDNNNQESPVVENRETSKTRKVATECNSNSPSSIKVLSPNGGEVYTAGQKVEINWSSCNVKNIYISMSDGGHDMGHFSEKSISPTQNSFLWTVPNITGSNYIIGIDDNMSIFDSSDKSFTINSETKTVSTANWKTYTNTKYGFELKHPDDWVFSTSFSNADGFFFTDKSKNKFKVSILPRGEFDHGYEEKPIISDIQINGKNVKKTSWNDSVMYQFTDNTISSTWIKCGVDLKNCNRIEIQGSDQLGQDKIDQIISTFKFIN